MYFGRCPSSEPKDIGDADSTCEESETMRKWFAADRVSGLETVVATAIGSPTIELSPKSCRNHARIGTVDLRNQIENQCNNMDRCSICSECLVASPNLAPSTKVTSNGDVHDHHKPCCCDHPGW